jgi:nucleotidyltransferase substrate binding protein (TIGR01987 family)
MNRARENFLSALSRFEEALGWEETPATRDSAILRFELCYETAWKAAQTFVREEGLAVSGPRQSFIGGFQLGWVSDEKVWDDMIRARNNAVHTYNEDFAKEMYRQLPVFRRAFEELREKLKI